MAQLKYGLIDKIKDKLPGRHYVPDVSGEEVEETVHRCDRRDSTEFPDSTEVPVPAKSEPRMEKSKSMLQKLKERLSGSQHGRATSDATNSYDAPASKDFSDSGEKTSKVEDNNGDPCYRLPPQKAVKPGMARNKSF